MGYKGQCKTAKKEFGDRPYSMLMARLNGEIRRMPTTDLNEAGIYLKFEENMGEDIGFYCMIQNKDAGPYSYTPMCFTIKMCYKDGALYPMIPPIVEFMSFSPQRIHPNLKPSGDVCISLLNYSYVGPAAGVSIWSPATTISSLMMTIGSLLTDKALKYEPGFEGSSDDRIRRYDVQLEYLCMKEIVRTYSDLINDKINTVALKHFSEELRKNGKDALQHVINKTAGKDIIQLEQSTFIESFSADYKSLHDKAIELIAVF